MITYDDEQIKAANVLLENLSVSGVDNCKRVVMVSQILNSGKPIENNNENGER